MMKHTEVLTRKEAAQYLRVSIRKLDELAATGEVLRVKLGSGPRARVLFRLVDLELFIEKHIERGMLSPADWASQTLTHDAVE